MGAKNTLIAYMTSGGVTKEYATIIGRVLEENGYTVNLLDINKNPKPETAEYDSIVIGTGVRAQRIYRKGLNFMKNDFAGKPVAFYISSNEAGTPESYQDTVDKYMNPITENHPDLNIVAEDGFGGRIRIFGRTVVDLTDPGKVEEWAKTLVELL